MTEPTLPANAIVLATGNPHKVDELRAIMENRSSPPPKGEVGAARI